MNELNPYPAYKDSGVPWLGGVPAHYDWNSLRFGLNGYRGIITSAYLCFQTTEALTREFGHLLLHTYDLKKVFYGLGSGLRQNLDWTDFKYLPCLVPPPSEQIAIVRFLNHADRLFRRYIRTKKKLIALLNEQKQAIIHRAVTRGLEPAVRLKPSGVEWLGDVPQHWVVTRLKFEASDIVDCLHATPRYVEAGGHPAIRTADVEAGRVRLAKARRVHNDEYLRWTSRLAPEPGDILYSREGERYGIAALVPHGVALCISQRMMVFRIASRHCSAFIMWQLNSRQVYDQAAADQIGATASHINVDRIKNRWLTLPPVDEQVTIATNIEDRCRSLETSIERIEQESTLIREYRIRLVADVVTGKLDVREAAACLPDVSDDLELAEADGEATEYELDELPELEAAAEEAEA